MASTCCLLYLLSLALAYCAAGEPCSEEEPIVEDVFGFFENKPVKRFTLRSKELEVQIITYGARIVVFKVPDKNGKVEDIILGFDSMEGYLGDNPYFGAIQGRVGNRIAGANFTLGGKTYYLTPNDHGKHSLSGGEKGFDKVLWEPYVKDNKLILSYLSEDGENHFPGTVLTQVTYEVKKNVFCFSVHAYVTKETPINILNHGHYNLAGQHTGPEGIYQHYISINADRYTELSPDEIPTGKILDVAGTIFDLRVPRLLGEVKKKIEGYDHNYCINVPEKEGLHYVARVYHPISGRNMKITSTQPGAQCYSGMHLPKKGSDKPIYGKGGVDYIQDSAFFVECQHYPDAVHHHNFPSIIVYPYKPYYVQTCYEFYTTE